MEHDTHKSIQHIEGSTGYHGAFPTRTSDGGSGGTPLGNNAPPLLKPAVLATIFPDPSHGTHGTAIRADIHHPGAVRSRLPDRSGGEAFCRKLELACEQLHRKYLAVPMMALTLMLMLRYLQLLIGVIPVRRWEPSLLAAYPYGLTEQIIHDGKFAVFRRRAVCFAYGMSWPGAKLPRYG